jgi:hypothetical protein
MANLTSTFIEAVDRALAGDWEAAHEIAQAHEGEATADFIHGVAHWMEGDLSNAGYWFGQAGRKMSEYRTAEEALRAIQAELRA